VQHANANFADGDMVCMSSAEGDHGRDDDIL